MSNTKTSGETKFRTFLDFYLKRRRLFEVIISLLLGLAFILINVYVITIEGARLRLGETVQTIAILETTSILTILALLPLVLRFDQYWPINRAGLPWNILAHAGFSVVFSVLHVGGMLLLRHLIFNSIGQFYDFGDWQREWLFEYLKDIRTYILILAVIYLYRSALARLRGDVKLVDADQPTADGSDRILVKKLGKEYILDLQSIEWLEAAGNYVNLHLAGQVYPLRTTMGEIQQRLKPDSFIRIHRSYMVNLKQLDHIENTGNGGARLSLTQGDILPVSRRYLGTLRESINSTKL